VPGLFPELAENARVFDIEMLENKNLHENLGMDTLYSWQDATRRGPVDRANSCA
jgi:hypothetical protein